MSQSGAFLRNLNRGDTELRNIITKITNLSSFTRNVRNDAARKIQKAWKVGRRREVRRLMRNIQAGHVNNLAKEFEKFNLVNRNNSGNVIMTNVAPVRPKKRKAANSNSNDEQTMKTRGREVELSNLEIGRGMGCQYAGIPRYMKKAKKMFDEKSIISSFLDYNIETNQYGIVKNIPTIVNRFGRIYNSGSRIVPTNQVHFFMIGLRTDSNGHAVSVLVDPRDPKNRRIWVFDPHGEKSRTSIWGKTTRKKIVPILQKMFKIPGRKVRYYGGRDLQEGNTRGVCTTFYVTFMEMIPYLLSGAATINQINELAKKNSIQIRSFYLNFAPETEGRVIVKNKTR